jgi:hypothetical protein
VLHSKDPRPAPAEERWIPERHVAELTRHAGCTPQGAASFNCAGSCWCRVGAAPEPARRPGSVACQEMVNGAETATSYGVVSFLSICTM